MSTQKIVANIRTFIARTLFAFTKNYRVKRCFALCKSLIVNLPLELDLPLELEKLVLGLLLGLSDSE